MAPTRPWPCAGPTTASRRESRRLQAGPISPSWTSRGFGRSSTSSINSAKRIDFPHLVAVLPAPAPSTVPCPKSTPDHFIAPREVVLWRCRPLVFHLSPTRPRCGVSSMRLSSNRPSRRSPRWLSTWLRRSEEHTSELQSHVNLVCRLLLEKKKKTSRNKPLWKTDSNQKQSIA